MRYHGGLELRSLAENECRHVVSRIIAREAVVADESTFWPIKI